MAEGHSRQPDAEEGSRMKFTKHMVSKCHFFIMSSQPWVYNYELVVSALFVIP